MRTAFFIRCSFADCALHLLLFYGLQSPLIPSNHLYYKQDSLMKQVRKISRFRSHPPPLQVTPRPASCLRHRDPSFRPPKVYTQDPCVRLGAGRSVACNPPPGACGLRRCAHLTIIHRTGKGQNRSGRSHGTGTDCPCAQGSLPNATDSKAKNLCHNRKESKK